MITTLVFYLLSAILVASAAMVVTARNPVHSVLFLILAFFNAAGLFLIAGAEFLAMILVIVYVGAVAVLFLFVVMMLDIDFDQLREGFQRYTPIGVVIGAILFVELVVTVGGWKVSAGTPVLRAAAASPMPVAATNTMALGQVIYTDYVFLFQTAGLILLVAMIGAIVLTLRDRRPARRQDPSVQHRRTPGDTIRMLDLPVGGTVAENGGLRHFDPATVAETAGERR
jgi:NADH-quinone oxidoreductase subunit J